MIAKQFFAKYGCSATAIAVLSVFGTDRSFASDEIPGAPQAGPIALVGAVIHPVEGDPIVGGTIVFDEGKIVAVGKKPKLPEGVRKIDVAGKHVYPGMILAFSQIGLVEIDSVRATVDASETGSFNPNVEAVVAINPDSEIIPVTRSNGILTAVAAPTGGRVAGQAGLISLDGWTWEDMTIERSVATVVEWPRLTVPLRLSGDEAAKYLERQREEIDELSELFVEAERYRAAREAEPVSQPVNRRLEALLPILAGERPLMVHADGKAEIESAVAWAAERKIRILIHGGYEAPHCAALLKRYDVPVIVSATLRLRGDEDDPYDAAYDLPERLRAEGVKYCISGGGRFDASNSRNLPYHAAMAVAYGLPHDEALRSVTLYPAEILGVEDRLGSLVPGKDATLIVTDGDPLEVATHVERAWIGGRAVDLSDRHKRLFEKYQEKYRRQK